MIPLLLSAAMAGEVGVNTGIAYWQGSARLEMSPGFGLRAAFEPTRWVGVTAEAGTTFGIYPSTGAQVTVVQARASAVVELLLAREPGVTPMMRLGLGPSGGFAWGQTKSETAETATTLAGTVGMKFRGALDAPLGPVVHLVPFAAITVHRLGTDVDLGLGIGWSL